MNRHARMSALLDVMAESGHVDVDAAAKRLQVSPSTIRRDLNQLDSQQLVTRTRGGAVATGISYDLPIRYRTASHHDEKTLIAAAAAALIPSGSVVGLNGGTTTTEVARTLASREGQHPRSGAMVGEPITILTNAINIANELTVRRNVKLIMTGGVARPESFELVGSLAADTLAQVDLDYAVIGVDAFDVRTGAKAADEEEGRINRLMVQRARVVVVVTDSSKIGAHAFSRICPLDAVTTLVTDRAAASEDLDLVRAAGVEVVVV